MTLPARYAGPATQRKRVVAIQRATADEFQMRVAVLTGKRRMAILAVPRHIAMHLAQKLTGLSTVAIGEVFMRDHTSVMHGVKRAKAMLAADPELQAAADRIEAKVTADA